MKSCLLSRVNKIPVFCLFPRVLQWIRTFATGVCRGFVFTWGSNLFFLPPQVNSLQPCLFSHFTWGAVRNLPGAVRKRRMIGYDKYISVLFLMIWWGAKVRCNTWGGKVRCNTWGVKVRCKSAAKNNTLYTSCHTCSMFRVRS